MQPSVTSLGFCETRMTDDTEKVHHLPGFDLFTNNNSSNSGGVAIYVKNEFNASRADELCLMSYDFESIFIEYNLQNKRMIQGVIYRRSKGSSEVFLSKLEFKCNKRKYRDKV